MPFKLKYLPNYITKLPEKLRLAYKCVRSPYFVWVPPGHFYSTLPDMAEVDRRKDYIYGPVPTELVGIDLRAEAQLKLLAEFVPFYQEEGLGRKNAPGARYFHPNGSFLFQDGFILHCLLRHLKPARLIEVGCGMSTCAILDTCETYSPTTRLTFIDPFPDFMLKLIRPEDRGRFELREQCIQDVDRSLFTELQAGDVLFIDTSHVSKIGSDLNHFFFQILPRLQKGVYVHFHDIWYPFEYPRDWLSRGIFWNEAYMLRTFLMYNSNFEIVLFNNYLLKCFPEVVTRDFPRFSEQPGASLWLRRC
jgi:hypothetical protein